MVLRGGQNPMKRRVCQIADCGNAVRVFFAGGSETDSGLVIVRLRSALADRLGVVFIDICLEQRLEINEIDLGRTAFIVTVHRTNDEPLRTTVFQQRYQLLPHELL